MGFQLLSRQVLVDYSKLQRLSNRLEILTCCQRRYYTVICEKTWKNRHSLADVKKAIEDTGGKYNLDMNFLYDKLRAQTWLHEFTHHMIVSNPNQPGMHFPHSAVLAPCGTILIFYLTRHC